jgi:RNA recognition motif-containing protein
VSTDLLNCRVTVTTTLKIMSVSSDTSEATDSHRKRKRTVKETNDSESDGGADLEPENTEDLEGPVLSHAEKRRRKREAKRAEKLKDGDVHPTKKRKLKDGTSHSVDTSTKRQNSVWVGNLSYKTEQEDLRGFFKWAGDITRINMPTKARGGPGTKPENRGWVQPCDN